jgi:hypothetical protein
VGAGTGFKAYPSVAVSYPTGVATVAAFDVVEFDSAGAWDAVNFRYTFPYTGMWLLTAQTRWTNPIATLGDVRIIRIINTGAFGQLANVATNSGLVENSPGSQQVLHIGKRDQGEMVWITVQQNSGAATTLQAGNVPCFFQGMFMGPA